MIREVPGGMPYGKRSESGTMGVLDPHESELFQVVRDGGLTMLPDPEYPASEAEDGETVRHDHPRHAIRSIAC